MSADDTFFAKKEQKNLQGQLHDEGTRFFEVIFSQKKIYEKNVKNRDLFHHLVSLPGSVHFTLFFQNCHFFAIFYKNFSKKSRKKCFFFMYGVREKKFEKNLRSGTKFRKFADPPIFSCFFRHFLQKFEKKWKMGRKP